MIKIKFSPFLLCILLFCNNLCFSQANVSYIDMIMFGRIIHSQMNYEKTITLNVSNYGTGMYFMRIISKDGAKVQKIVKK